MWSYLLAILALIAGGFIGDGTSVDKGYCPICDCGISIKSTKIVGGNESNVHEFPWMAALLKNGIFFCGGTLINNRYVLTAAHCVMDDNRMDEWSIVLAEHDRGIFNETNAEIRMVNKVIRHPEYIPPESLENDIALLSLSKSVTFKLGINPACLPETGEKFGRREGIVAGWGTTRENGYLSPVLMKVAVPILTHDQCLKMRLSPSLFTRKMLCAGREEGGVDSCQGDSGGAMLVENSMQRMVVAGIVSWGEGCAKPQRPGVYTKVTRYLTWIQQNTNDSCPCSS